MFKNKSKNESNKTSGKLDLQTEHELLYNSGLNPTLLSKLVYTCVLHQICSATSKEVCS